MRRRRSGLARQRPISLSAADRAELDALKGAWEAVAGRVEWAEFLLLVSEVAVAVATGDDLTGSACCRHCRRLVVPRTLYRG